MEEWVGRQWHRFITRAAAHEHADAAVELPAVKRSIELLFRAAGGAPAVRLADAADPFFHRLMMKLSVGFK